MQQNGIRHNHSTVLIAGILLLAAVLRCWNISQSFWWDEIWSTIPYATSSSVWHTISSLGYYFNNHLFYSLLARFSIMLLGENEIAARLPAVIMGLGGVAALFFTGKKFLGTGAGILGALLLAVSAFHIDHSTEARGYAGLSLFALLSSYYFLNGLCSNRRIAWVLFSLSTILGFYTHPFIIAVCLSQFFCALLFYAAGKTGLQRLAISFTVVRNTVLSLLAAAILTLALYAPVLPSFMHNMGKVRIVAVTRWPFLVSLFSSWCPGIASPAGTVIYGALLCLGIMASARKAPRLAVYSIVLVVLPLSLYLLLNPMFVFERYFIFALPFIHLTIASAMASLAERLTGPYRFGLVSLLLLALLYLQWPSLHAILTQDRQDYRDALQFVEHTSTGANTDLVFSIGYAGEHFRYYAHSVTVALPESLTALKQLSAGKKHIWCLITAWLPAIRPAYEDRVLYAEKPEQVAIYNYIKQHFRLKRVYQSKYPVEIYYADQ